MKKQINVLSLFDGISCGQQALKELKVNYKYYASEIHVPSIKVTQHNHPNTIQLGTVTRIRGDQLPKIDLLMGGSPCQGFTFNGVQLNFNDPRSKLFFEFVRLLKELKKRNPKIKFLLENVRMRKQYEAVITKMLGVKPIEINSSLFSAQARPRLYWTNIPLEQLPEKDSPLLLKHIVEKPFFETNKTIKLTTKANLWECIKRVSSINNKCYTILTNKDCFMIPTSFKTARYAFPVERERASGLPDNYTAMIKDSQRYKAIGNGWEVNTIKFILKNITK